jgi:hypothetical protein
MNSVKIHQTVTKEKAKISKMLLTLKINCNLACNKRETIRTIKHNKMRRIQVLMAITFTIVSSLLRTIQIMDSHLLCHHNNKMHHHLIVRISLVDKTMLIKQRQGNQSMQMDRDKFRDRLKDLEYQRMKNSLILLKSQLMKEKKI